MEAFPGSSGGDGGRRCPRTIACGGVPYKALAAAEDGAETILVPMGLGTVVLYRPTTVRRGPITLTTYEKVTVGLEEYLLENGYNVSVVEVGSDGCV